MSDPELNARILPLNAWIIFQNVQYNQMNQLIEGDATCEWRWNTRGLIIVKINRPSA